MKRRLRDEIQQTRPFTSVEEEVYLEILRTAQVATRWILEALKPSALSAPQFNVLRILRGAGAAGLASGRIAERMVNWDPDLTRLLDRLERRGLVEKARDTRDRRVVNACITPAGLDAVATASAAVRARLRDAMGSLSAPQLEQLADLLEVLRAGDGAAAATVTTTHEPQEGGDHELEAGSRTRHRSDRQSGRRDGARAARQGSQGPRGHAAAGVRSGQGAGQARRPGGERRPR
jgi:DNA-binding MarR family transcriptional regulator